MREEGSTGYSCDWYLDKGVAQDHVAGARTARLMEEQSWQPWPAYLVHAMSPYLLSTVPSRHLNSDEEALGCEVFMQSLLSEPCSISDSEAIFFVYVCH